MSEIVATANTDYNSKQELIEWINDLLKITKIESLGTGSIYSAILDYIHPGKVAMSKLNWKAKVEYEFLHNFKILQQSFQSLGINKQIEINKLIKCKYLDNLEILQWFKKYFDVHTISKDYDPVQRRGNCEVDFSVVEKLKGGKDSAQLGKKTASNKLQSQLSSVQGQFLQIPKNYQNLNILSKNSSFSNLSNNNNIINSNDKESAKESNGKENEKSVLEFQKNSQFEAVKSERDFYFSKLKDIDHLLDASTNKDQQTELLINKIRQILYCTPEKIVLIFEDGNVKISGKDDNQIGVEQQELMQQELLDEEEENLHDNQNFLLNDNNLFEHEENNQIQNIYQNSLQQQQLGLLQGGKINTINNNNNSISNNLLNNLMIDEKNNNINLQNSQIEDLMNNLDDNFLLEE